MKIGIYGENSIWREKAAAIVETYAKQILSDISIYYYSGKEELLECDKQNRIPEVLFLDMDLKDENGIEVVKEVNEKLPECLIVYYSENINYATEVYCTDHIYFVLKEQFSKRIEDIFQRIFWEQRHRQKRLIFSAIGGKKVALLPEEIIYFERIKRITRVVTSYGDYEIRDKLDSILEKLPEREFIRCHNSYIVCRGAIYEKQKSCFVMKNGDNVTISRSYIKTMKDYFEEE